MEIQAPTLASESIELFVCVDSGWGLKPLKVMCKLIEAEVDDKVNLLKSAEVDWIGDLGGVREGSI